ncbi:hypothetical protein KM043_009645 [Ampulex compressa]|nr:hypothetical protein KM043_009645 [Ampulex compressa]
MYLVSSAKGVSPEESRGETTHDPCAIKRLGRRHDSGNESGMFSASEEGRRLGLASLVGWRTAGGGGGYVGRVCMAAESPVAIINQKGSQPSVGWPAGQPHPARRVSRGRHLRTNLRVMPQLPS